jgi:vacuolar iron transporter family protein
MADKISFNVENAKQLHREGRAQELHGFVDSKLIKAAVYGANDGIITTFAVVAGVAGAGLSPAIILIMGFANLIADALSMGIGDYLGERSEQRFKKYQYKIEKWEIDHIPEEEAKELISFFEKRGVKAADSHDLVKIIRKYPKLWTDLGYIDEMGSLIDAEESLWTTGFVTFLAFMVAGAVPLMPYVLEAIGVNFPVGEFPISIFATGATLFLVGSLRTLITKGRWWWNGLEMLGIGAIAAVAAYFTGQLVHQFTN